MIKDRAQKISALKFCVSKGWLPQLEVDVEPSNRLEKSKFLLTDLDVMAITNSPIGQHMKFIFDCKSSVRESPIARTFWLRGVMHKVSASHGFVVLGSKSNISIDHRITSSEMGISLLKDNEFQSLSLGFGGDVDIKDDYSSTSNIELWDEFLFISKKYDYLNDYSSFSRSKFWGLKDSGEQCRKIVAKLRSIRNDLDPAKPEHLAIFVDALCLFILSLSGMANKLFLIFNMPSSKDDFSSMLLTTLYGGYENYNAALKIRQLATGLRSEDSVSIFPDTNAFEKLIMEVLQAPQQAIPASLLSRDICLSIFSGGNSNAFQKVISKKNPYSSKFLLLSSEYLQRALKLPPEFNEYVSKRAFELMS